MVHYFSILCVVLSLLATITGCAATKVAPDAVSLKVEYAWTSKSKCSSVSPEIRVAGIPVSTKQLNIKMTDWNKMEFHHGGGTVKYEGSEVISAGALKEYIGPCPPREPHNYSIQVDAVDVSGIIIGSGEKTLICCP